MHSYSVRVRGIYATALSILFHRRGFRIVDASEVMRARLAALGVVAGSGAPQVTVKSLEDSPDEVLILGYPWEAGLAAEEALLGEVEYASPRRGRLGLYTVVDALSLGGCRLLLPGGGEGRLDSTECPPEGSPVRATVVRDALDPESEPLLRPGVRLIGDYVMVHVPGEGFSFSEHIRPERRVDLVAATAGVDVKSVHVHFRSASRSAPLEALRAEVQRLAAEASRLAGEPPSGKPAVVVRGEYLSIVYLPRPAKGRLDALRGEAQPTVELHHTLKAGGRVESSLVDFAEECMRRGHCTREAGLDAELYLAKSLEGRRIHADHRRPDGARVRLGPFTVVSAAPSRGGVALRLERVFRSPGVLDGLGVEKRPGDRAVTRVDTASWSLVHEYQTPDGRLLGVYANVNTPPELSSRGIRYLDLYVDVVYKPGGEAEIIDADELDRAWSDGLLTRSLYRRALEEAERLARTLPEAYGG
ncbi:MAG: DUF402 domain-containing protein [Desulfurococcales archaeon]|nr:DUF402 domain-containing protein [Desulfurococcales archaeon]